MTPNQLVPVTPQRLFIRPHLHLLHPQVSIFALICDVPFIPINRVDSAMDWTANISILGGQQGATKWDERDWYWDSAANVHFTPYRHWFNSYEKISPCLVHGLGGGSEAVGIGSVVLEDLNRVKHTLH